MVCRTIDLDIVIKAVSRYKEDILGFYPQEWLSNKDNVALVSDDSVALFERVFPGVYCGHYFFSVKGKSAIILGEIILDKMFREYDAQIIKGYTPLTNLGARWMSRKLGFTGYGVIETMAGPCELFILSKKEYLNG